MRTAVLVTIMGLGEDETGDCLGLRAHVEKLAETYPLYPMFLTYKLSTAETVKRINAAPKHKKILTGHSLGAGQAYEAAKELEDVNALGMWEPVPEGDAFNGGYKFEPLKNIPNQQAMRVDGPFPFAWGREFSDDAMNIRIHPWKLSLFPVAVCHAEICQRPEVLDWYEETVKAVCEWEAAL